MHFPSLLRTGAERGLPAKPEQFASSHRPVSPARMKRAGGPAVIHCNSADFLRPPGLRDKLSVQLTPLPLALRPPLSRLCLPPQHR